MRRPTIAVMIGNRPTVAPPEHLSDRAQRLERAHRHLDRFGARGVYMLGAAGAVADAERDLALARRKLATVRTAYERTHYDRIVAELECALAAWEASPWG
ncbi:hypothetical protein [Iamia sp.]|uniref:hypothetical protein n=1 Tax=Iamia sp. TaxID=2722710 RepID=UPI002BFFB519|nr:hypothetical protein [Iamia sp.]HXH57931.1 hypothetical protein [Iamia sp.]